MEFNFFNTLLVSVRQYSGNDFSRLISRYRAYKVPSGVNLAMPKQLKIVFVEKIDRAASYMVGKDAAYGDGFFILDKRGFKLFFDLEAIFKGAEIEIESGFDGILLSSIVEQLIFFFLLKAGIVPVHSSAVALSGKGLLFCAWGGTGKTRLILNLVSRGAEFVCDEWSFIHNGLILPLKADFSMYDYDLNEYPEIGRLGLLEKMRVSLSCAVPRGKMKTLLGYGGIILPVKRFAPEKIFRVAPSPVSLHALYLLRKTSLKEPERQPIEEGAFLSKVSLNFCHEFWDILYYYNLYNYALTRPLEDFDSLFTFYKRMLSSAMGSKSCFSFTLPHRIKELKLAELLST